MRRRPIILITLLLVQSLPLWAQIPVTNGDGATIEDIIREKSLCTIILDGNVRDPNLIITDVNEITVTFQKSDGSFSAYPMHSVKEIRVQVSRIAEKKSVFAQGALSTEEQHVVDRAAERVREIYDSSRGDQEIRMYAESIMAVMGNQDAIDSLMRRADSNDTSVAVMASLYLYTIGMEIDPAVIVDGFLNGNRETRTNTAMLAGLSGDESFLKDLRYMLSDPSPEAYPWAARALAQLNDRQSLPSFYKALESLYQSKTEAAIYALITMGDDEVIAELNSMLPRATPGEWIRIVRILYALGDEEAVVNMRKKGLTSLSHQKVTGLLLGENEDWDGIMWIRKYLKKQYDPNYKNLIYRANLGYALYDAAQAQAKIEFQNIMGMTETGIYAKGYTNDIRYKKKTIALIQAEVCRLLGQLGDKTMLTILTRAMAHEDKTLALAACDAAVQIAKPEYRERIIASDRYRGYRELLLVDFFK
jgi:HEAT repeat protein